MIPAIHGIISAALPIVSPIGSKLWLEADYGVTVNGSGHVTQVLDQSGNGYHLPQSSTGTNTTVVSSAINGLPALSMTNSRHAMNFAGTLNVPYWLIMVAKFNSVAALSYLFDSAINGNRNAVYVSPTDLTLFTGNLAVISTADTNTMLLAVKCEAPTGQYSKNGGALTSYSYGAGVLNSWQIGQRYSGSNPFNGYLAAFVVENNQTRALDIMASFKYKYGI